MAVIPSFMENIYDRNSVNMLMAKTLEMNHFSEGKFQQTLSSFELMHSKAPKIMSHTSTLFNPKAVLQESLKSSSNGFMAARNSSRTGTSKHFNTGMLNKAMGKS